LQAFRANFRFNHRLYGLKPNFRTDAQHVFLNDDLPNRLAQGMITVKRNILRFIGGHVIEFTDGTRVEHVDAVVMATGYSFGFPMLTDQTLIPVKENSVNLYKYIYPPDLPHSTLVTIGLFQSIGALMPISEMQCRLVCDVIAGRTKLPTRVEMWKEIEQKRVVMAKRYSQSRRHTVQIDFVDYMDDLATMIGAKPDFWRMAMSDPGLWAQCILGPCSPCQYRLIGPHAWPEATNSIITVWNRVTYPMNPANALKPEDTRPMHKRGVYLLKNWKLWTPVLIVVLIFDALVAIVCVSCGLDIF